MPVNRNMNALHFCIKAKLVVAKILPSVFGPCAVRRDRIFLFRLAGGFPGGRCGPVGRARGSGKRARPAARVRSILFHYIPLLGNLQ